MTFRGELGVAGMGMYPDAIMPGVAYLDEVMTDVAEHQAGVAADRGVDFRPQHLSVEGRQAVEQPPVGYEYAQILGVPFIVPVRRDW